MIKGYQAELMDMYEKTRTEESRKLTQRREEIKNKYYSTKTVFELIYGCFKRN